MKYNTKYLNLFAKAQAIQMEAIKSGVKVSISVGVGFFNIYASDENFKSIADATISNNVAYCKENDSSMRRFEKAINRVIYLEKV